MRNEGMRMSARDRRCWFAQVKVSSWIGLCKLLWRGSRSTGRRCIFRGEAKACWTLNPSILRKRGGTRSRSTGAPQEEHERQMLAMFKAEARAADRSWPTDMTDLDWLAVLQHFGGSTRLLDCTRSPFVALYFAAQPISGESSDFVLWQIDEERLLERSRQLAALGGLCRPNELRSGIRDAGCFRRAYMQSAVPLIAPVTPAIWNPRLARQQGLFLCSSSCVSDYGQTLESMFHGQRSKPFTRILIPGSLREEVQQRLYEMNIHSGLLFPDLEGTARRIQESQPWN
jgi:hypothetical protein